MNKTYLLLGSNIGESKMLLEKACVRINEAIGKVIHSSHLYSTKAWGNTQQPDFLNQVIVVETILTATQTLANALAIEQQMGRTRKIKNEPRIIDIDILLFGREIIHTQDLIIPHPALHLRRFVLVPLNEIAPRLVHPVLKKNIRQLLQACPDKLGVNKI